LEINAFAERMIELLPLMMRGFAKRQGELLTTGQITMPQVWVLECLENRGGCRMNEIAEFLSISRPAATGMIDRLICQGLAKREGQAMDRRVVRACITPKGRRLMKSITKQKKKSFVDIFGMISPAERSQYLAILERVVEIMNTREKR